MQHSIAQHMVEAEDGLPGRCTFLR